MGAELEPKRNVLKGINQSLERNIFFMLNNLNLRHNNCAEGDKNYKKAVASMTPMDLEHWYDVLLQLDRTGPRAAAPDISRNPVPILSGYK